MISYKTENDIRQMRCAGLLTWCGHKLVSEMIRAGVKTIEIDEAVERLFVQNKAIPLFKGVPGHVPYPATICISINDEVVHGIPGSRVIQDGDIVGVDTGCRLAGWCGDSANTYLVGTVSESRRCLVRVTQESLNLAIRLLAVKKRWSDIAREMEQLVKSNGFSMVEVFVGHGIGREMHEEPQVPNFVYRDFLKNGDFEIRPGLVIAVEPMVNAGTKHVRQASDGWTMHTTDGKASAHVEHTIGILKSGPFVLTGPPVNPEERTQVESFFAAFRAG